MLVTHVITDRDEFLALRPAWNELLQACPVRTLFITHAWLFNWWSHFGGTDALRLVTLYDHDQLVGIAPLTLYKRRLSRLPVTVLGTFFNMHVSRADFVIRPDYAATAMTALAEYFSGTVRDWDVLMLRQLPADTASAIAHACRGVGLNPFPLQPGVGKCYLQVDATWTDYLSTRTRHFRKRLKEHCRRPEKLGVTKYINSVSRDSIEKDFELLRSLEQRSWKHQDDFAAMDARDWQFQKSLALSNDEGIGCENIFLALDDNVVAAIHSLSYAGVIYAFQMIYDEQYRDAYLGRATFKQLLESVWQTGQYSVFDFNGNSPFCKSWTDQEYAFFDLQAFNGRPYSRFLAQLKAISRWFK
ncbi:MAG: GNAT family N-acetyltransferase [Gammaproteobacteria bacterium]